jgi:hypothetical protein
VAAVLARERRTLQRPEHREPARSARARERRKVRAWKRGAKRDGFER